MKIFLVGLISLLCLQAYASVDYCNVYIDEKADDSTPFSKLSIDQKRALKLEQALKYKGYKVVSSINEASLVAYSLAYCQQGYYESNVMGCNVAVGSVTLSEIESGDNIVFNGEDMSDMLFDASVDSAFKKATKKITECEID